MKEQYITDKNKDTVTVIKMLMARRHQTISSVAAGIGTTRQNLSQKLKNNKLTENDIKDIAAFLSYDVSITFTDSLD